MQPLKNRQLFWILCLACLLAGCQPSGPQVYEHPAFSFDYPPDWQLMSDLWPNYASGRDYYHLGVTEIVMVTSAQKQGESGAYFAVASTSLPAGMDLETLYRQTYAPLTEEITEVSEQLIQVGGASGFEIRYRRPWGEPWWQFRDIWVEKEGTVFVLSFHAINLDTYQENVAFLLERFVFK
jgi:hypothetical protein